MNNIWNKIKTQILHINKSKNIYNNDNIDKNNNNNKNNKNSNNKDKG